MDFGPKPYFPSGYDGQQCSGCKCRKQARLPLEPLSRAAVLRTGQLCHSLSAGGIFIQTFLSGQAGTPYTVDLAFAQRSLAAFLHRYLPFHSFHFRHLLRWRTGRRCRQRGRGVDEKSNRHPCNRPAPAGLWGWLDDMRKPQVCSVVRPVRCPQAEGAVTCFGQSGDSARG